MSVNHCQVFGENFTSFWKQNYNISFFDKNSTIYPCSSFAITIYFCYEWKIFEWDISDLWDKVSKKVNALCRVTGYISIEKRSIVLKTFVESQFNYCSLIWMLHSRTLNIKINCLHERAPRIVDSDYKSSFNTLLEKDGSFLIHHRNIHSLAIEI